MLDQLIEIPRAEWVKLRDLYKVNWPKNLVGFYTIDNFIRWVEIEPNIKHLVIYSLNGDWSDGTFLVVDRYQLFLNSLNDRNDRLTKALSLLDWTYGFKISSFLERHRPAVLPVIEERQLKKEFDSLTSLYYLSRSEAPKLSVNCPEGITLKSISEEDAKIIDDLWPNRHEGSLFFVRRLINKNANVGAYTKDGELVAWCLRLQAGPLGALQVKESHQRRGLACVIVAAMVNILANLGHDCFALVNTTNIPSQRVFAKLGFKVIDNAYWLRTYPLVDFHWED